MHLFYQLQPKRACLMTDKSQKFLVQCHDRDKNFGNFLRFKGYVRCWKQYVRGVLITLCILSRQFCEAPILSIIDTQIRTNNIFWEGNFAKLLSGSSNQWVRGLRAVWFEVQVFIFIIMREMLQDNTLDSALQSPSGASKEQSHSIKSSTLPDRQELFASWDKLAGSSKANPVLIVRL